MTQSKSPSSLLLRNQRLRTASTDARLRSAMLRGQRVAQKPANVGRTVGAFVPRLTQKAFEKYGFSTATLLTEWDAIVGAELARFTRPDRLKWPRWVSAREDVEAGCEGRPGATLILRVLPARALEVEYGAQQIVERINGYFGYRAIAELKVLQAPLDMGVGRAAEASGSRHPGGAAASGGAAVNAGLGAASGCAADLANLPDDKLKASLMRLQAGLAALRS